MRRKLDRLLFLVALIVALAAAGLTGLASASSTVLFGDQNLETSVDNDAAGEAEAFPFTDATPGNATSITVYVDSHNRARSVTVGLYNNSSGRPGTLLAYGTLSGPRSGAWATLSIANTSVAAGRTYWVAILGTGGTVYFRDRSGGKCVSVSSSRTGLSSLPSSWTSGGTWNSCPISAYVSGTPLASPANTTPPQITGSTVEGQTLSTSNGSWSNNPTGYSYQWQDCDTSGNNCLPIPGATASTYTLQASDLGDTIRAVVTASNSAGSASATSNPTATIAATMPPPANTAEPVITGTVATGQTLTTSNGSWSNDPTGFSYQWQDCASDGTSCSNITGATSSTYTVGTGDAGHTIDAVVTATNSGGATSVAAPIVPAVDNFTGSSVDTNVWDVMDQQGDTSNNEVECYLPSQTAEGSNALTETMEDIPAGFTCPSGTPDSTNPLHYESGAVQMRSVNFTYGTVVVKAEMGSGSSGWPAIWLLGAACQAPNWLTPGPGNTGYNCPWPGDSSDAAEIDIAEVKGGQTGQGTVWENLITAGGTQTCEPAVSNTSTNFHTYELDWTPSSVTWKIDGVQECQVTTNVPTHPMFLIINTAQQPGYSYSGTDVTTVDYVHVSH